MLKWLTLIGSTILIVAVILVARYDKLHDTEGKGYDIKCTQSSEPSATTGSLICTAGHSQKAKSGEHDPPWWHVFFTWPEGITALLITLTLGAIVWQAMETRKAAVATMKYVKLQEGQLRQWVNTTDKWELRSQDDLRRIEEVEITISLGIENPTPMLLTLSRITTVIMGQTKEFSVGITLPREEVYVLEIPVNVAGEDFIQFKTDSLKTSISMRINFVDAFGDGQVQDLNYTAICGPHRIRDLCLTKNT
jgi:hypothetical protein